MTPKQIAGYLKVRRARSKDAMRGDPLGGITFNDGYNVPTFGITKAAYDAISRAMHDEYGMAEPSNLTSAHVKKALLNQEARTGHPVGEPSARHHATKKSPAQLQREIDEALAKPANGDASGIADQLTQRDRSTLAWVIEDWPWPYRDYAEADMARLHALGLVEPTTGDTWGGPTALGRAVWARVRKTWIDEHSLGAAFRRKGMTRAPAKIKKPRRATGSRVHATKKTDRSKTGLPVRNDVTEVQYHRPPTASEIRFGHGATHYRTFPVEDAVFPGTRVLKKWIVADDGLRYYR